MIGALHAGGLYGLTLESPYSSFPDKLTVVKIGPFSVDVARDKDTPTSIQRASASFIISICTHGVLACVSRLRAKRCVSSPYDPAVKYSPHRQTCSVTG